MSTHPVEFSTTAIPVTISHFDLRFPHEAVLTLLLAHDADGELVGTVTVKAQKRVAEFNRLFVKRECRKMGIGKRLVQFVVDAARSQALEGVSCIVHPDNLDGLAFYRRLGFFEATRFDDGGVLMTIQL